MQIALFGMSADPPHRGHGRVLRWLARHFDHVAVWAADNPYKQHQCPLRDRQAMLKLMIQDLPVPPGRIALYEELSHRHSLVSAQQARERWPQAELTLIVGADLVEQLPHWYKAAELFQLANILVMPRPGYRPSDQALAAIRQQGGQVAIAETLKTFEVSSSYYRQTEDAQALPTAVRAYINQRNLYPCTASSKEKQAIS
ncbi:nicotinate-nucleotide adenylyltransferase [Leptolyngbya iicbica LK]|uniref:Probable nicotinate-nucleotide adenylyltransferase n=3 Tax=Cyanophyceae TaxID=3028117 RepID=A0A4Q7E2N0_9CYAN|nr:nicotinate-nucleotide adenylyltransferase [Leptolyngbya sp. LK]